MRSLRFDDLREPFAPFSSIKEKKCSRKKTRCLISGTIIEKGEDIYAFQLFSLSLDVINYAKKTEFEASDYFVNYRDYFLKNNYSIKHFKNFEYFSHPGFKKILTDFSLDKAIKLIFLPTTLTLKVTEDSLSDSISILLDKAIKGYPSDEDISTLVSILKHHENFNYLRHPDFKKVMPDFSLDKAIKQIILSNSLKVTKGYPSAKDISTLVSILIKCGYSNQILDRIDEFPKITLILLAMLDDRRFQNRVANILKVKDLPIVFEIMRKKKLSLNDFTTIKSFSKKNKPFITLLSSCIEKYPIHLLGNMDSRGCFMEMTAPKNCRLVYFFIVSPEQLPLLMRYINNKQFSASAYMKCYYYTAAMFYLVDKEPSSVLPWIENMKNEIGYYVSGSPNGFINYSIKMIKEQLINDKND